MSAKSLKRSKVGAKVVVRDFGLLKPFVAEISLWRRTSRSDIAHYAPKTPRKKREIVLGTLRRELRVQYVSLIHLLNGLQISSGADVNICLRLKPGKEKRDQKQHFQKRWREMSTAYSVASACFWNSVRLDFPKADSFGIALRKGWKVVGLSAEGVVDLSRKISDVERLDEYVADLKHPPTI